MMLVNEQPGDCPLNSPMDNRGNIGVSLPSDINIEQWKTTDGDYVAWAYSTSKNSVPMNFTGAPFDSYNAYPVYSIETPKTVRFKVDNIVKKYKLGGVWFWTLTNDAIASGTGPAAQPEYSLFHAAYNELHK